MRSEHQKRIEQFMELAGQKLPPFPVIPSREVRELRARLILEEALETIAGLGFEVIVGDDGGGWWSLRRGVGADFTEKEPSLIEIADGCADLSVVTIGTLSACGIQDVELLAEVDASNLRKFGPGGHRRADGKWIKSPDFVPPDVDGVLVRQGWLKEAA